MRITLPDEMVTMCVLKAPWPGGTATLTINPRGIHLLSESKGSS